MVSPIFCSLGMFIIDDNEYAPAQNRSPEYDVIGGGGPYAVIGARIIAGPLLADRITGIIDRGNDFPQAVEKELKSWRTALVFRDDPSRKTTRGMNKYDEHDVRHFFYLNPKKRIEAPDIIENPVLLASKCFHLICSIERCEELIDAITLHCSHEPIFVYEPLPSDCTASNFEKLTRMLHKVDVFTPNLNEAAEFFNKQLPDEISEIKRLSAAFKQYMKKPDSGVVLRCGPLGCYINSDQHRLHLPAYHQDQEAVVDVTGGGNAFCGGFIAGLYLSKSWLVGAICGNLASGCVIEKLGMPVVQYFDKFETWNGRSVSERLAQYLANSPQIPQETLPWL